MTDKSDAVQIAVALAENRGRMLAGVAALRGMIAVLGQPGGELEELLRVQAWCKKGMTSGATWEERRVPAGWPPGQSAAKTIEAVLAPYVQSINNVGQDWGTLAEHEPANKYVRAFNERLGT